MFVCILFVLLQSQILNANIWDNIFGNYNAPLVYIPPDFHVQFGISREDSPYILDIDYSTTHKASKIQGKLLSNQALKNIATMNANLTEGKLYLHTSRNPCIAYQAPSMSNKLNSKSNSFNQSLQIVDPNTIFQLMSLYKGTEDGLIKYDVSSLFENGNTVFMMFDAKTKELDSIEIDIVNQKLTLYTIGSLDAQEYEAIFFQVPQEWDCGNPNNQADFTQKSLEEFVTELVTSTYKEEMYDQLVQALNSTLGN